MEMQHNGTASDRSTIPSDASGLSDSVSRPTRFGFPQFTPEKIAEIDARRKADIEERDRIAAEKAKHGPFNRILRIAGGRYDRNFEEFETYGTPAEKDRQRVARDTAQAFAENLKENVADGRGIVFIGPCGCGKDFLLACTLRAACYAGINTDWANAADLHGDIRDRVETESSVVARLSRPMVLGLSDIAPPGGASLTQFEMRTLMRLVDARYRRRKPTFVTCNVASADDAVARLGAAIVDRLRESALVVACDWPSYRSRKDV